MSTTPTRRQALGAAAAATALATPSLLRAQSARPPVQAPVQRNVSSFRTQYWRDHFDTLGVATIVADTQSRALHYWNADASDYRVFPTSIPISEDLTKRGYTEIVRKKVGPDWTPTPSQVERNPELRYMPPGPDC